MAYDGNDIDERDRRERLGRMDLREYLMDKLVQVEKVADEEVGIARMQAHKEARVIRERLDELDAAAEAGEPPEIGADELEWLAFRLEETRRALKSARRSNSQGAVRDLMREQDELRAQYAAIKVRRDEEDRKGLDELVGEVRAAIGLLSASQLALVAQALDPETREALAGAA